MTFPFALRLEHPTIHTSSSIRAAAYRSTRGEPQGQLSNTGLKPLKTYEKMFFGGPKDSGVISYRIPQNEDLVGFFMACNIPNPCDLPSRVTWIIR